MSTTVRAVVTGGGGGSVGDGGDAGVLALGDGDCAGMFGVDGRCAAAAWCPVPLDALGPPGGSAGRLGPPLLPAAPLAAGPPR